MDYVNIKAGKDVDKIKNSLNDLEKYNKLFDELQSKLNSLNKNVDIYVKDLYIYGDADLQKTYLEYLKSLKAGNLNMQILPDLITSVKKWLKRNRG